MKVFVAAVVVAVFICGALAASPKNSPEVSSFQQKVHRLETNAKMAQPSQTPTIMTEQEVNSYLASDQIELPTGVQSVKLQALPGLISGIARVDFDRVRAGTHSSNPLLSIFSGVHDVAVATHSHGAAGQGYVHVDSVSLDGVEVPNFLLQLFVEKYLQPKYPQIGMDSQFKLPDRIDSAKVGSHEVTLVQK